MLDGLLITRRGDQAVLYCPEHPKAPLNKGHRSVAGAAQFCEQCSVDGCHNLAYAESEEALSHEVRKLGHYIP